MVRSGPQQPYQQNDCPKAATSVRIHARNCCDIFRPQFCKTPRQRLTRTNTSPLLKSTVKGTALAGLHNPAAMCKQVSCRCCTIIGNDSKKCCAFRAKLKCSPRIRDFCCVTFSHVQETTCAARMHDLS